MTLRNTLLKHQGREITNVTLCSLHALCREKVRKNRERERGNRAERQPKQKQTKLWLLASNLIESALKTRSVPVLIHPQPDLPASGANVEGA